MSVRKPTARRRSLLRLESLEGREVPATGLGLTITGGSSNQFAPPDTDGAVGPNNYVQFINGLFAVFNKTTGAPVGSAISDSQFWQDAGVSASDLGNFPSDTRVIYDPLSGHWFAVELGLSVDSQGNALNGDRVMVARSNTSNPAVSSGWKAVTYVPDGNGFSDYPTLGVDANAIYIGINDFTNAGPLEEFITSIPKADLLLSTPSAANRSTVSQTDNGNGSVTLGFTPQGVTNFNAGQTSSSHGSILAEDFNQWSRLDLTRVTGSGAAGAAFGTPLALTTQSTGAPGYAHQPDGTAVVGGEDGRLESMVYQVGDLIFAAYATPVGGRNAIRITVISDSTRSVVKEATISSSTYDYSYPSIAMNAEGDMIIGFTRSGGSGSSNGNLGAFYRYAHIDPTNPAAGITVDPTDVQIKAGVVSNYHLFANEGSTNPSTTAERWGDFSATGIDPNNPTAFWTTQEYAVGASTWGTEIGQVYVSPRVKLGVGVSSTAANGTYTTGQMIPITVTFNDAVNVTGTPTLTLNDGAVVNYSSGSGTNTLTFNYTVAPGQNAAHLDYASATALSLNGGTIRDVNTPVNPNTPLDAILTLPAPGAAGSLSANTNFVVDTAPRISGGVSSTVADGTYGVGTTIPITVTFSSPVVVSGTPQLALNAGGGAVATYAGGSGTATLTFNYVIAAGQTTSGQRLEYASTSALTLSGGTIKDAANASVNAVLTLPAPGAAGSLSANKNIVIDTTAPAVTTITSTTADGTYFFGATISITLTFNKSVDVTGTPALALNSGGMAGYAGGSGTNTLTFNYTVGLNDFAADLDEASASALTLNGGTIFEHNLTNPANLTVPAPQAAGSLGANKSIAVDGRPAGVTGASTTTLDGTYGFGAVIPVTVTFDKPVDVTGNPQLSLNSGTTLTYTGGDVSGVTSLTFTLTVGLSDTTNGSRLDYTSTGALTLNGGSIQDHAGPAAAAGLTLPAPGAAGSVSATHNIVVDGTPAKVSNITSTAANGTYGLGAVIPITLTFTKPVDVTGTPQLALSSGGTAVYTGGSGTDTLTFTYTVAAGENTTDLDEASAAALTLNGGTIQDHASNTAAPLAVPASQAVGSLGANKNIQVDTSGPTVVEFRVKFGTKWYNLIGSPRADVPWKVTAIQVVFDKPVVTGSKTSLTGLTATGFGGLGTTTLTWTVSPILKGSFTAALATTGASALKDKAGNAINPFTQVFKVLYGDFNGDLKVDAVDEAGVRAALPAPYQPPTSGYNLFADLDGNGFVNLTDVGIARSRKGTSLP